ncbi:alpha/beta fold hydrolase [Craterilacuibacter sinensis]|uniref:Alpha/beta fold hydrolase n=1 Tax=Craterilacuibacter sinensis TaxID=2686017 RepID=A0A845BY78_9NEIS|nr:alpha/beta fold hydrolase [Craterilacuibacter sinensis]MXR37463.1 alpha/beta fold hydrolase [Craterilacuibacter sinensis]
MHVHPSPIPEGRFVTLPDGLKLHYHDEGTGLPVLWLHGSGPGASGYSNFKGNVPAFSAAGYRSLVLDLPGFGLSDKPDNVDYDLDFFVAKVAAFLEAVGVTRCAVLGNSLGGAIALGLALKHSELVSALILMAPGGVEERETYFAMAGIQRMVETYSKGPMGPAEMRHVMTLQLFDPALLSDELIAERAAIAPSQPKNLFSTMRVPNMTQRLAELACPVFGFWGQDDQFNPVSGVMKFLAHTPDVRFTVLNRCGHWVQVEHRELFNRQCLDFLKEQACPQP